MKVGVSNTARTKEDSGPSIVVQPDAMTWASTWEMMNKTLESFATRNTDFKRQIVANLEIPSKNLRNSRTIQMVALIHGLR